MEYDVRIYTYEDEDRDYVFNAETKATFTSLEEAKEYALNHLNDLGKNEDFVCEISKNNEWKDTIFLATNEIKEQEYEEM